MDRVVAIVFALMALTGIVYAVSLAARHQSRISQLEKQLADVRSVNRRYLAAIDRIGQVTDDLIAQFQVDFDSDTLPRGNLEAASVESDRNKRLAKHTRDLDAILAATRGIAEPVDRSVIDRDTTTVLYKRIHLSELLMGMQSATDAALRDPMQAEAALGDAADVGSQVADALHDVKTAMEAMADDLVKATFRQAAVAKKIRLEMRRLQAAGPFSP